MVSTWLTPRGAAVPLVERECDHDAAPGISNCSGLTLASFCLMLMMVSSSEKMMSIPGCQSSASIQGWRSVDNHAVPGDEVTCVCQASLGAWGHHCCALLPGNFSSGWEWETSWTWVWWSWTRPGCHLTSPSDPPKTHQGWVRWSFKTILDDGEKLRHNPELNHLEALTRNDLWHPPVFVWQIVQTSFSLHKFWRAILDNATEVLTGYKGQKQQSSFKGPQHKASFRRWDWISYIRAGKNVFFESPDFMKSLLRFFFYFEAHISCMLYSNKKRQFYKWFWDSLLVQAWIVIFCPDIWLPSSLCLKWSFWDASDLCRTFRSKVFFYAAELTLLTQDLGHLH